MDLRVMAAVTVAITIERLAPAGEGVARVIGLILIVAGVILLARSAGFG
jgi:predicted metal-binding membrane protein